MTFNRLDCLDGPTWTGRDGRMDGCSSIFHGDSLGRPRRSNNLLDSVAIEWTHGDAVKPSTFRLVEAVAALVGIQSALPLAEKHFPILNGPKEGVAPIVVARSTTKNAATNISAVACSVTDVFPKARATVNNGAATTRNMVEHYGWTAADTGNAMATHSCATGLFVVKVDLGVVRHAALVGATETGKDGPVSLEPVFVGTNVGTFASLVWDTARVADAITRSEMLQFGFSDESSALGGSQILARSIELSVNVRRRHGSFETGGSELKIEQAKCEPLDPDYRYL